MDGTEVIFLGIIIIALFLAIAITLGVYELLSDVIKSKALSISLSVILGLIMIPLGFWLVFQF